MLIYALATVSLIKELSTSDKNRQDSYTLMTLQLLGKSSILDNGGTLTCRDLSFGYFTNAKKTWLLVEESSLSLAICVILLAVLIRVVF